MDTIKIYCIFGMLFLCLAHLYETRSVDCEVLCLHPDSLYSDYCECPKIQFPFGLSKRGKQPFRYGKREFTGLPIYTSDLERFEKRGRKPFRYGKRDYSEYPLYESSIPRRNYEDVLDLLKKSMYEEY